MHNQSSYVTDLASPGAKSSPIPSCDPPKMVTASNTTRHVMSIAELIEAPLETQTAEENIRSLPHVDKIEESFSTALGPDEHPDSLHTLLEPQSTGFLHGEGTVLGWNQNVRADQEMLDGANILMSLRYQAPPMVWPAPPPPPSQLSGQEIPTGNMTSATPDGDSSNSNAQAMTSANASGCARQATMGTDLATFSCGLCGFVFTAPARLSYHHPEIKCGRCGSTFSQFMSSRRYRNCLHPGPNPFRCKVCGAEWAWKRYLDWHICQLTGLGRDAGAPVASEDDQMD